MLFQKIKYKFLLCCKRLLYSFFSCVSRHQKLKKSLVIFANTTRLHKIFSSVYARATASIQSSSISTDSLYKDEELSLYAKQIYEQLTKKYLP